MPASILYVKSLRFFSCGIFQFRHELTFGRYDERDRHIQFGRGTCRMYKRTVFNVIMQS